LNILGYSFFLIFQIVIILTTSHSDEFIILCALTNLRASSKSLSPAESTENASLSTEFINLDFFENDNSHSFSGSNTITHLFLFSILNLIMCFSHKITNFKMLCSRLRRLNIFATSQHGFTSGHSINLRKIFVNIFLEVTEN